VLVIIAASHLDAVTFQIGSQSFKILPTALFAAWLLGQRLTGMQWGSAACCGCRPVPRVSWAMLADSMSLYQPSVTLHFKTNSCLQVLVAGVILITLNGSSPGAGGPNSGTREDYDLVVGLGASAASGLSSAYAGVYFEKCVVCCCCSSCCCCTSTSDPQASGIALWPV
jgi:Nucleotide-sugar transporter